MKTDRERWNDWRGRPVRIVDRALGFPIGIVSGTIAVENRLLIRVMVLADGKPAIFNLHPTDVCPINTAGNLGLWHKERFMAANGRATFAPLSNPPTCCLCLGQLEPGEPMVEAAVAWDDRRGETSWTAHEYCAETCKEDPP